jgi:hypothetical protein
MKSNQTRQAHAPVRLIEIMGNDYNLYEGDLIPYFKAVVHNATNLNHPYHNFRHMMHVTWLSYDACAYYQNTLNPREMRNLLIAAMFHDFDHRGVPGDDSLNIDLAVKSVEKYIIAQDQPFLQDIQNIIQNTQFPYTGSSEHLSLCSQIIRDADISQSLDPAWLQQVIFGLAAEWKRSPIDVLQGQVKFTESINFCTAWAQSLWPKKEIEDKIAEISRLLQILGAP